MVSKAETARSREVELESLLQVAFFYGKKRNSAQDRKQLIGLLKCKLFLPGRKQLILGLKCNMQATFPVFPKVFFPNTSSLIHKAARTPFNDSSTLLFQFDDMPDVHKSTPPDLNCFRALLNALLFLHKDQFLNQIGQPNPHHSRHQILHHLTKKAHSKSYASFQKNSRLKTVQTSPPTSGRKHLQSTVPRIPNTDLLSEQAIKHSNPSFQDKKRSPREDTTPTREAGHTVNRELLRSDTGEGRSPDRERVFHRELSKGEKKKDAKMAVLELADLKKKYEASQAQLELFHTNFQKLTVQNQQLIESQKEKEKRIKEQAQQIDQHSQTLQEKDEKIKELGNMLAVSSSFLVQQKQEYLQLTRQIASLREELLLK